MRTHLSHDWYLPCAVLAVALLSACDGPPPNQITVLGEDFSNTHAMEALKKPFESANEANVTFVKNDFDIFDQKATSDLDRDSGQFDIILHYSSVLSLWVRNEWVLTTSEQKALAPGADFSFEDDLFPFVWKDSSWYPIDGTPEPIGYPFAANTMVLVYNRLMFEDQGNKERYVARHSRELSPPTKWEEFRDIAEFFTDPSVPAFGVVLQGASGSPLYWEWCNFAFGMGGGVMDKEYGWSGGPNTPLLLTDPATVRATKLYLSLKPFNVGDFFSTTQAEQQERMKTQSIAMAIMWSDSLYSVLEAGGAERFGFAPIPGSVSMSGGGTYYVNRASNNPGLAVRYVASLMNTKTQATLMKKGLTSANRSAYDDPDVQAIPYVPAVYESLDRAVYMLEAGPDAALVREVIERRLQEMWRGEIGVEEGLLKAQEEIERRRKDYVE